MAVNVLTSTGSQVACYKSSQQIAQYYEGMEKKRGRVRHRSKS